MIEMMVVMNIITRINFCMLKQGVLCFEIANKCHGKEVWSFILLVDQNLWIGKNVAASFSLIIL